MVEKKETRLKTRFHASISLSLFLFRCFFAVCSIVSGGVAGRRGGGGGGRDGVVEAAAATAAGGGAAASGGGPSALDHLKKKASQKLSTQS